MIEATSRSLVFATVGADHHPFQRLVDWVDDWARVNRHVDVVVQYGSANPPTFAHGEAYLAHADLQGLMARAAAIVTQGGPTGIAEARRRGVRPIVMPRGSALGEHVDNHQQAYASFLAEAGDISVASTSGDLNSRLDDVLARPQHHVVDPTDDAARIAASVMSFAVEVKGVRLRQGPSLRRRRALATRLT